MPRDDWVTGIAGRVAADLHGGRASVLLGLAAIGAGRPYVPSGFGSGP